MKRLKRIRGNHMSVVSKIYQDSARRDMRRNVIHFLLQLRKILSTVLLFVMFEFENIEDFTVY
jgi:hypothetical protein